MPDLLHQLHRQLIVSVQAWPYDPLDDTDTLRRIARAAVLGGAAGLRLNSAEHVRAVRKDTSLPIIAIEKSYAGGSLRITPDFASAAALAAAGADIIALDCTDRAHTHGEPWREILARIHAELHLLVMADIATLAEGIAASAAGADLIGTTLHGYTPETEGAHAFNFSLLADLARETGKPIVAEGHISTPALARRALDNGAYCVVAGSAITRPADITATFVRAMQSIEKSTAHVLGTHVLGVDIGGTSVKAAVVSPTGEISLPTKVPTSAAKGRDAIAKSLAQAIEETLSAAKAAGIPIAAIGVASAGAIDSANGTVFAATENLPGWAGFDLRAFVQQQFHLPVFVENDAHAAVLAELHFGVGQGLSDFVAVTLGTGVGGGVVMGGQLQRGQLGFAGTIGHQTIRFDGRLCNCGRRGCLEAYVSTVALIAEYEALAPDTLPMKDDAAKAFEISHRAAAAEPTARAAYIALAGYLAEGIANLFNILDPEAVILSGGLIEGNATFLDEVQARVQSLLHFGAKRSPKLLRAAAGHYAGVQGAAAAAFTGAKLP